MCVWSRFLTLSIFHSDSQKQTLSLLLSIRFASGTGPKSWGVWRTYSLPVERRRNQSQAGPGLSVEASSVAQASQPQERAECSPENSLLTQTPVPGDSRANRPSGHMVLLGILWQGSLTGSCEAHCKAKRPVPLGDTWSSSGGLPGSVNSEGRNTLCWVAFVPTSLEDVFLS